MVREGANSIVSKGPFPGRKKSRSERLVKTQHRDIVQEISADASIEENEAKLETLESVLDTETIKEH